MGFGGGRGLRRGFGIGYGRGLGRGFTGPARNSDFEAEPETSNSLAAEVARLKAQLQALEERLADSK